MYVCIPSADLYTCTVYETIQRRRQGASTQNFRWEARVASRDEEEESEPERMEQDEQKDGMSLSTL